MTIRLAHQGEAATRSDNAVEQRFEYDLSENVDSIRPWYAFDVPRQGTVRQPSSVRWKPLISRTPFAMPSPSAAIPIRSRLHHRRDRRSPIRHSGLDRR